MGEGKPRDPHLAGKQICHNCGSKEVRYLRKTRTIYCRACGAEWSAKWVEPPTSKRKRHKEKGG